MSAANGGVPEDPGPEPSWWHRFKEWLLPKETLSKSAHPKSDLKYARALIALFYVALTGVIIYTVARMCYSGRIEVFTNLYKVDFLEAPSLAFCPFNANDEIQWPGGAEPWVAASKVTLHGTNDLKIAPQKCAFNPRCACVSMSAYHLNDVLRNHSTALNEAFREQIEIRTNFSDPSEESVLKVGLYDSYDESPDWLYVNQGAIFIGQLELIVWTVVDVSISGLVKTFTGDIRAMAKNRHIFRYTSQQVGNNPMAPLHHHHETSIRYEMKTFFVEETMSSPRAFSLYTIGVLIALYAMRVVITDAFFALILPEWKEYHEPSPHRMLSPTAVYFRNLFCFCCFPEQDGEDEALLKGTASDDPRDP